MKRLRLFLLLGIVGLLSLSGATRADEIVVAAAASLTDALNAVGKAFTQAHPQTTVHFDFASSGALEQQIVQGAPVDVFASAAAKEMDELQKGGQIVAATRVDFAGNHLVLIAPRGSNLKTWEDLGSARVRRVAISDPASVPSGRYAQETLQKRGLWTVVQPKAVLGENVRQTLTYVANGDVEAGIVFATDAQIDKTRVRVVQEAIPGKDHTPILYPAAVIASAPSPTSARRFVAFLQSPTAQRILRSYGFTPAHPPQTPPSALHTPAHKHH